ncbi:MAG TPA: branched-chain amino acid ABC transporter permease [Methylomirabilota bacterium]|jgi:branched-chain amino acid transport system permease protein|nr:branched-chain amino acid ABC transporter permease [Methylomirabilota bacterium]
MQIALDLLLGGISLGGIYALVAFALSLSLATTHVLNVAHGTFMVLGAALATLLFRVSPVAWPLGVLALLLAFALLGLGFEAAFVRPFAAKSPDQILVGSILVTFGFALAVEALLGYYWARWVDPQPAFSLAFPLARITVLGVAVSGTRLTILLAAAGAIAGFHLFLRKSALGRAIRAVAQNYAGAVILGVNPRRVSRVIYLAGIVATAGAGVLLALAIPLEPYSGLRLTLVAMTIVVIGGVGSLPGALLGGGLLGMAEVLTAYALGSVWSPVVSLLVFFSVLVVRPEGLWGRRPG